MFSIASFYILNHNLFISIIAGHRDSSNANMKRGLVRQLDSNWLYELQFWGHKP